MTDDHPTSPGGAENLVPSVLRYAYEYCEAAHYGIYKAYFPWLVMRVGRQYCKMCPLYKPTLSSHGARQAVAIQTPGDEAVLTIWLLGSSKRFSKQRHS